MKTIILHSKEKDIELLQELREALIAKGFEDRNDWNNVARHYEVVDSLYVWERLPMDLQSYWAEAHGNNNGYEVIPVSRDDFQTMFLLY